MIHSGCLFILQTKRTWQQFTQGNANWWCDRIATHVIQNDQHVGIEFIKKLPACSAWSNNSCRRKTQAWKVTKPQSNCAADCNSLSTHRQTIRCIFNIAATQKEPTLSLNRSPYLVTGVRSISRLPSVLEISTCSAQRSGNSHVETFSKSFMIPSPPRCQLFNQQLDRQSATVTRHDHLLKSTA